MAAPPRSSDECLPARSEPGRSEHPGSGGQG
jgi:hypothetical protein